MNKLILRRNNNFFPFDFMPTLMPEDLWQDFHKSISDMFDLNHRNLRLDKGFPKGDVFLDGDNVVIELGLAGYKKEQLSVRVEENALIVSASKHDDSDGDKGRQMRRSAFTKVFSNFTNDKDLNKSEITYEDGLLRIIVPPAEKKESKSKELLIK